MLVAIDIETGTVLGQVVRQASQGTDEYPDLKYPLLRILTKAGYMFVPTINVRVEEIK